jgi:hypothetical protein
MQNKRSKSMITKQKVLSDDFHVLVYIYEQTEIYKNNVYFKKIIEETGMKQNVVSKSIDRLYDKMMIDASWARREDGCWAYCFTVSDSFMGFTKGLYNATEALVEQEESKNVVEKIKTRKDSQAKSKIEKDVAPVKMEKEKEFM